jgi:hypothetical protein
MTNEYLQKIILNPISSREEYMFAYMILQQRTQQQDYYNQLPLKVTNV